MSDNWTATLALAEEQWGLITKQQAETAGVAWTTLARRAERGLLQRVAHGVYRVRGGAEPDHVDLRAAWLQIAPRVPAWERTSADGVVSHRSAATLYGIGHLPADIHEFTLPARKQTRRKDVRMHRGDVDGDSITLHGLPVTRPSRIAADLLADREDPGAVAEVIVDSLRPALDHPQSVASAIAPHASAYGLRHGDGIGLLRWLLELSGDPDREMWLTDAMATELGSSARRGVGE
jgi:predicted transcriptional regulator of viral defense system